MGAGVGLAAQGAAAACNQCVHPGAPRLQGTWLVPCQFNERACHINLSRERALGVADLSRLAGYHRYSASWLAAGNHAGIHSMAGLQAALCAGSGGGGGGAAAAAQQQQQQQQQQQCPACPACAPQPCTPQPCMPQAAQVAAAAAAAAAARAGEAGAGGAAAAARALAPPRQRSQLGQLLEEQGLQTGAELGVQARGGGPTAAAGKLSG